MDNKRVQAGALVLRGSAQRMECNGWIINRRLPEAREPLGDVAFFAVKVTGVFFQSMTSQPAMHNRIEALLRGFPGEGITLHQRAMQESQAELFVGRIGTRGVSKLS